MSNPFKNGIEAIKGAFGSMGGFGNPSYTQYDPWGFGYRPIPSSQYNYKIEAGPLWENSIVMSCTHWLLRTFPEAQLVARDKPGMNGEIVNSRVVELFNDPNPDYDGATLMSSIVMSYILNGNSYLYVETDKYRRPLALYNMAYWKTNPYREDKSNNFIDGYMFRNGKEAIKIPKDKIIHLRYGQDPNNEMKGMSPLASVLREVCTDNEAATAAAAIMRNLGIPGLTFIPSDASQITDAQKEAMAIKAREKWTGDRRGELAIMPIAGTLEQFGFEPDKMAFDIIRRVPEERICGVLGIPAVVAQLGAGLERSTFNNYEEARKAAYQSCLIPLWNTLGYQLTKHALPKFSSSQPYGKNPEIYLNFDYTNISALQEDKTELHARVREDYKAGGITLKEFRTILDYQEDGEEVPEELINSSLKEENNEEEQTD